MKTERIVPWMLIGALLCGVCLSGLGAAMESRAKTVKAQIFAKTVKIGDRIKIKAETQDVTYKSSNSVIASVDTKGVVTGKKAGKVKISVHREGYTTKKYTITVKKRKRKPSTLPVTFSEVSIDNEVVNFDMRTPTGELTGGTKHNLRTAYGPHRHSGRD